MTHSSLAIHSFGHSVTAIAGWVLLAIGVLIYAFGVVSALLRIRRQYSRTMLGSGRLRLGAIQASIARLWPALILVVIGIVLIVLGR